MNYGPAQYAADTVGSGDMGEEAPYERAKKPGFIKRWILRAARQTMAAEQKENMQLSNGSKRGSAISGTPSTIDNQERAMQFTVHVASGGRVVETRRYDRKTDRTTTGLYVITSDQDFGHEIDKIITMEALR